MLAGALMVGTELQAEKATGGERFGKYTLFGKIAAGGMASVFLGRERTADGDRWVAIKRVHPHLVTRRDVVQMFLNEAKILSRLDHKNICGIIDFGIQEESPYIVMRYLHGAALSGLLRRLVDAKQPLPVDLMASIAASVCDGLHYAHEANGEDGKPLGLVHRDISPQNIFITFNGQITLLDFGVAKATGFTGFTRTGHIKGKYAYMSPEQVEASPLDRRSDIFSLGIVLWESLAGRHLFRRKRHIDTLRAIANAEVPAVREVNPEVPSGLDAIVLRALNADRRHRYQTAKEMGADLWRYLQRPGAKIGAEQIAGVMSAMFPDRRHPSEAQGAVTQPEILALVTETEGPAADPLLAPPLEMAKLPRAESVRGEAQPETQPDLEALLDAPRPSDPGGLASEGPETVKPRDDSELRAQEKTQLGSDPSDPRRPPEISNPPIDSLVELTQEVLQDPSGVDPTLNDYTGQLTAEAMQEIAAAQARASSLARVNSQAGREQVEKAQEEFEDATLQLPMIAQRMGSGVDPRATIPDGQPSPLKPSGRDAALGMLRALSEGSQPPLPMILEPSGAQGAFRPRPSSRQSGGGPSDPLAPMAPSTPVSTPLTPSRDQPPRARPERLNRAVLIMVVLVLLVGLGAYLVVVRLVSGGARRSVVAQIPPQHGEPKAAARQPELRAEVKEAKTSTAAYLDPAELDRGKTPRSVSPAKRSRAREMEALARKSQSTGDLQRAEKLFIECVKIAALPTCHRSLGSLYASMGDETRSIAHYRRYLELAPEAVDAAHIKQIVDEHPKQ